MTFIALVAGGGLGSLARYLVTLAFRGRGGLPWAVFTVNVVASALGGTIIGLFVAGHVSSDLRLILVTGVAGGLSTFSTWSVETVQLYLEGKWRKAGANVILNLVVGLAAATAGYLITTLIA